MKTAWKLSVSLGAVLLLFPLTVQSASRSETKASVEQKRKEHSGTEEQNRLLRLQIFLDDSGFRPGAIDGHWGEFTRKALARYQQAQGQEKSLQNNRAPDDFGVPLDANSQPLTSYQITEADEKSIGPVAKSPEEQSKLKTLMYGSIEELVAEKFHANIDLIKKLNPGSTWKANETVQVPNIATPFDIEAGAETEGRKEEGAVRGRQGDGRTALDRGRYRGKNAGLAEWRQSRRQLSDYAGSERLPAPKGEWKIDRNHLAAAVPLG
jgi:peptidoglycan hydrolase-like protein with peptidoglycan-binding domain